MKETQSNWHKHKGKGIYRLVWPKRLTQGSAAIRTMRTHPSPHDTPAPGLFPVLSLTQISGGLLAGHSHCGLVAGKMCYLLILKLITWVNGNAWHVCIPKAWEGWGQPTEPHCLKGGSSKWKKKLGVLLLLREENGVRDARPIQVHRSGTYCTFNYAKLVMYFPLVYSSLPADCRPRGR